MQSCSSTGVYPYYLEQPKFSLLTSAVWYSAHGLPHTGRFGNYMHAMSVYLESFTCSGPGEGYSRSNLGWVLKTMLLFFVKRAVLPVLASCEHELMWSVKSIHHNGVIPWRGRHVQLFPSLAICPECIYTQYTCATHHLHDVVLHIPITLPSHCQRSWGGSDTSTTGIVNMNQSVSGYWTEQGSKSDACSGLQISWELPQWVLRGFGIQRYCCIAWASQCCMASIQKTTTWKSMSVDGGNHFDQEKPCKSCIHN